MNQVIATTVVSLGLSFSLHSFPPSLEPLAQDLSTLAREHFQHPSQKIPVVGIGGCPGVGKTTLTNLIDNKLKSEGINSLIIHFDDWTNPENARQKGYFDLEGVHVFFNSFLSGFEFIDKPVSAEFEDLYSRETVDLSKVDIILFEGLLAVSGKEPTMNYAQYCDRQVYIDADEKDIGQWKKDRPSTVKRTEEEFAKHMEAVLDFHHENIAPFKNDASWIVSKDTSHGYSLISQL